MRHNYAVRSELREFDLQKYIYNKEKDSYILYHYEIKSMPAGTMRGAEERKFFRQVIPNYQKMARYLNVGFMLGGLYQGKRAASLDRKVQEMIRSNPGVTFISGSRVVIGGKELWQEFTGDNDFFNRLESNFKAVIEYQSVVTKKRNILELIEYKKNELVQRLKEHYQNVEEIIENNI